MDKRENEFGVFLQRLSSPVAANARAARAGGLAIASYQGVAGDESLRTESGHHILTMCVARPARFEGRDRQGRIYAKQPGALSLIPAGLVPPLRSRTEFELLVAPWMHLSSPR
jgi:hypothetical protein